MIFDALFAASSSEKEVVIFRSVMARLAARTLQGGMMIGLYYEEEIEDDGVL